MIRWQIVLDTMKDVNAFVNIVTKYKEDFVVTDSENNFKVNAKSMMGMLYSTEGSGDVFLTCETEPKGLYNELADYIR